MKWIMKFFVCIFAVALVLGSQAGIGLAVPSVDFSYVEKDLGAGGWEYDYTLTNTSPTVSGFDLWYIDLGFSSTLISSVLPTDWDIITDGSTFATLESLNPGVTDIVPQASADFIFVFNSRVGDLPYGVLFTDPQGGDPIPVTDKISHAAIAPVPEPSTLSTLLFFASGLAGLVGFRKWFARI